MGVTRAGAVLTYFDSVLYDITKLRRMGRPHGGEPAGVERTAVVVERGVEGLQSIPPRKAAATNVLG